MPSAPIDNRTLLRRTLVAMSAMVGACVVVVGGLLIVALSAVGHVVSPGGDEGDGGVGANSHSPGTMPSAGRSPAPFATSRTK